MQATRIIPRKGVELSIDFVTELKKKMNQLRLKEIYNGKKIRKNAEITLILAGYAEDEKRDYLYKLKSKTYDNRVRTFFLSDNVKAERSFSNREKIYSLWDAYVHADIITFPSIWEGWGNQFIEAVFAKKPVVLFEYPVFKQDIKSKGYEYISLGDKLSQRDEVGFLKLPQENIAKAADQTVEWLLDKNTTKKLEKNFKIGKRFHNCEIVEKFLRAELDL